MSTQIKLRYDGIKKMLNCDYMKDCIRKYGEAVQRRAGESYRSSTHYTGQRVAADVRTNDRSAIQDNLENNTLLKALKGGL